MSMNWTKTRFLAYGFLLGSAGLKVLTSKDAKKVYTKITAAGMRCADETLRVVDELRENAGDIAADARQINEDRKREETEKVIEDAA
ncbi:MAG: hypothetical protein IKE36_03090 [Solobacterium sp.]|nr:hypothetical protein [Solobacterium sp.]